MRRGWLLLGALAAACTNGVGEPCAENRPCAASLECVYAQDAGAVGLCDYPLGDLGARCETAASCGPGLTCSSHFTPGERYGSCVHQRGAGELCTVDRDCVSGRCEPGLTAGAPGRCAP